jgi:hypothetical protein
MTERLGVTATKEPVRPASQLKELDVLVGRWNTRMREIGNSPAADFQAIGTDTYEWLEGGYFLVHHVDVRMAGKPYKVIEIIGGYDEQSQSHAMRSFDSQGVVTVMQASRGADGSLMFAGEKARAKLIVGADGNTMQAHWERSDDGLTWLPWMDLRFTRAA